MKNAVAAIFIILLTFYVGTLSAGVLGDVNNDGKLGLSEAVYALQVTADIKSEMPASSFGFGNWEERNFDTVYKGESDGFVVTSILAHSGSSRVVIRGYTDSSQSPATLRAQAAATDKSDSGHWHVQHGSFTMPVKKGDYWKVETYLDQGGSTKTLYWISLGGGSSDSEPDLNYGLVAYYPFNGDANDESGNKNNGAVNGASLTEDRFGSIGSSYEFNNDENLSTSPTPARSYVTISDSQTLRPNLGITVSVWIKAVTLQNQNSLEHIIAKQYGSSINNSYCLTYGDGNLTFHLGNSSGMSEFVVAPYPSFNEWHHISGVWDGSVIRLYTDGILSDEALFSGPIDYDNNPIIIGADDNNEDNVPEYGWNGLIDDIRIYNRALSESEIKILYNNGETHLRRDNL